jgi:hypothetical protein
VVALWDFWNTLLSRTFSHSALELVQKRHSTSACEGISFCNCDAYKRANQQSTYGTIH